MCHKYKKTKLLKDEVILKSVRVITKIYKNKHHKTIRPTQFQLLTLKQQSSQYKIYQ
jgi:hypothetical protein